MERRVPRAVIVGLLVVAGVVIALVIMRAAGGWHMTGYGP